MLAPDERARMVSHTRLLGEVGGLIGTLISTLWSCGHYKLLPDTQKPTERRCCEEDNAGNTLEVNHI